MSSARTAAGEKGKRMKKVLIIITILISALLLIFGTVFLTNYSLVCSVVEVRDNQIIVETLNGSTYRFIDRITLKREPYGYIKLYTDNYGKYCKGDVIFSLTSGGSEDSNPPGIGSRFDFRLLNFQLTEWYYGEE